MEFGFTLTRRRFDWFRTIHHGRICGRSIFLFFFYSLHSSLCHFNGGNLLRNLLFIGGFLIYAQVIFPSVYYGRIVLLFFDNNDIVEEEYKKRYIYIFYENNLYYCSNEMALFIQPIIFRSKQLPIPR